jgi:hypothetical protein
MERPRRFRAARFGSDIVSCELGQPPRQVRIWCDANIAERVNDVDPEAQLGERVQGLDILAKRLAEGRGAAEGPLFRPPLNFDTPVLD